MIDASLCGKGDFSAEVYYDGRPVGFTEKRNLSVTGQLEIKLTEKHIWELGCGRRYDLILKFGNDEVKSYFGLRSIALDGMKFKLNGKSTLSYEEFYERYRGLAHAILDNPAFMGFCYTQLTDIEQEQNGLFSYEGRKPKFDVNILKKINSKKAAIED